jgi:hypothetical protein
MDDVLIFAYTRKDALANGVLVDITKRAKEVGFSVPIAVTSAVWHRFIEIPNAVFQPMETERVRKMLLALCDVVLADWEKGKWFFPLRVESALGKASMVTLKGVLAKDDDGAFAFTVMLPDED